MHDHFDDLAAEPGAQHQQHEVQHGDPASGARKDARCCNHTDDDGDRWAEHPVERQRDAYQGGGAARRDGRQYSRLRGRLACAVGEGDAGDEHQQHDNHDENDDENETVA